jgi:hypothetical protein
VNSTTPATAADSEAPINTGEGGEVPCHPTKHFADSELTDDVFRPMWIKGEPLVVTGLLSKFKILWSPEYFIEKYGSESCLIVECQKDTNKRVTVGEFFSWFGKYEERKECWKLKVVFYQQDDVSDADGFNRTGLRPQILRSLSQSYMKILPRRFLSLIMFDAMAL